MVVLLMMPAKLAAGGLIKINVFSSKFYEAIMSDQDVTSKSLSRDSKYIVVGSCDQSLVTLAFL